ncbi:unnamed protein product [Lathyrus sativus]|nr:unnamed protein product [Lathyrus sativus]
MENLTTKSGAGGGSGGTTRFLVKTYHMVEDLYTDNIVSRSQSNNCFIIMDPDECVSNLSKYFRHNNFSSFVRLLNTYGFHKIKHDQWEFSNEYFLKDQYYLLGNIHRKKTVHSHSLGEVERLALEEEIEKLANEKASIELDISSFNQYMPTKKLHVVNLVQRLKASGYRHNNLKNSFELVLQYPKFVKKNK